MQHIIVSDIFGLTDELVELSEQIAHNPIILDPYKGKNNLFSDEQSAYQYFTENVGLEKYACYVFSNIPSLQEPVTIIAFSVGGAAIWQHSDKLNATYIKQAHLFYSSQIRNMLNVKPAIPVNVIVPRLEEHFSVTSMAEFLNKLDNVSTEQCTSLHGFMNKLSCNFNPIDYETYILKLRQSANLSNC